VLILFGNQQLAFIRKVENPLSGNHVVVQMRGLDYDEDRFCCWMEYNRKSPQR
jgi:hypothetical protein